MVEKDADGFERMPVKKNVYTTREAFISIGPEGRVSFSRAAYEALGHPVMVSFWRDHQMKRMKVKREPETTKPGDSTIKLRHTRAGYEVNCKSLVVKI